MSRDSKIEWCDDTWNPLRGCTRVSEGCRNCYAERVAARFSGPGQPYAGLAERTPKGPRWTGEVRLVESALDQPLRWKRPRRIFVNSMSDLFHESVPDAWIDRVFAVMALAPQHVFQVLTKRPDRMQRYLSRAFSVHLWSIAAWEMSGRVGEDDRLIRGGTRNPLPNVWLGVSVEDQPTADARIPPLLATLAAVRFVSAEPLLEHVELNYVSTGPNGDMLNALTGVAVFDQPQPPPHDIGVTTGARLDWVIVGGESGPGARPIHPDWARSLRDQCAAAGTAFFFKQWGEWAPGEIAGPNARSIDAASWFDERWMIQRVGPARPDDHADDEPDLFRVGKRAAGRLLDGRTHDAMPEGLS